MVDMTTQKQATEQTGAGEEEDDYMSAAFVVEAAPQPTTSAARAAHKRKRGTRSISSCQSGLQHHL
jgi:hypothetical protein